MVRDAATLVLVRDGAAGGIEVLLLQRSPRSAFAGGAHVFPGGALDPLDGADAFGCRGAGRTDADCSARLGLEAGGLAFWVAAVRECFEEAGLLLARRRGDGEVVSFADPAVAARFSAHRAAVDAGRPLAEVLDEEGLVLALDLLHYVSHWITPEGASRRYDTRFFVAAAPPGQVPRHDDRETVASTWIGPGEALARHRRGDLHLVLPTIRNLEALLPFATAGDVVAAARVVKEVPTIRPRPLGAGSAPGTVLPGDDAEGLRHVSGGGAR